MKKALSIISLIITVGCVGTLITSLTLFKDGSDSVYKVLAEEKSEKVLGNVDNYHFGVLNGSLVISSINRYQETIEVSTITGLGTTSYPKPDYSIPNLENSTEYIDPNKEFIGTVVKDPNGIAEEIIFTELEIFNSNLKSADDLTYAKELVVDAISNGSDTSMTWEELATIIDSVLGSNTDEEYLREVERLEELIKNKNDALIQLTTDNLNSESMQDILDSLSSIMGYSPSQITSMIEIEQAINIYKEKVTSLTLQLNQTQELVNKYPGLINELENLKKQIEDSTKLLVDLNKNLEDLNKELDIVDNVIGDSTTNKDANETSNNKLIEYINSINNDISNAENSVADLNTNIILTKDLVKKAIEETANWDSLEDDQIAIKDEYVVKLADAAKESDKYKTLHEAQVVINTNLKNTKASYATDIAGAKSVFKQWLGTLYNEGSSVDATTELLVSTYTNVCAQIGLTGVQLLDMSTDRLTAMFRLMSDNIISKYGYVLDKTSITGIIAGIKTIPGIPLVTVNTSHVHTASCYNGDRHVHSGNSSSGGACYEYYNTEVWVPHSHGSGCYHSHSTSGSGAGCYGYTFCTGRMSASTTASSNYYCSTHKKNDATVDYIMRCGICGNTGSSGSYKPCSSSAPSSYACGKSTPVLGCGKTTSTIDCTQTGYWAGSSGYRLKCTLDLLTYYSGTTVVTATCSSVVTGISVLRNPMVSTIRDGTINTSGLVVVISYLNETQGLWGSPVVTGSTSSSGSKTGTVTYTGKVGNAKTNGTRTSPFTFVVN